MCLLMVCIVGSMHEQVDTETFTNSRFVPLCEIAVFFTLNASSDICRFVTRLLL